jgi:hypothetical protein
MSNSFAIIAKIQTEIARIELFDIKALESTPSLIKSELLKTQDYESFQSCLQDFMSQYQGTST